VVAGRGQVDEEDAMAPDAPFPSYRDVDFNIVVDDEMHTSATHNVAYNGLMLEYSTVSIARYRSPEDVLANPELAANLAVDGILADPHGLLAPLHQAVSAQYAQRRWVLARCAYEQQVVVQVLEGLRGAATPTEALWLLSNVALFLSGLLAEASLRPPTHRRCLLALLALAALFPPGPSAPAARAQGAPPAALDAPHLVHLPLLLGGGAAPDLIPAGPHPRSYHIGSGASWGKRGYGETLAALPSQRRCLSAVSALC
jgi:hypothetical protein